MEYKSNPKIFLESVYSNLKNPINSCWIQVSFESLSRGYRGKHVVGIFSSISICNEIEGNIDLRKCSSILGILEKPVIPRSNKVLERQNNTFLTQKQCDTRIGVTLWNSNTNS